jgi:hypothetical protein
MKLNKMVLVKQPTTGIAIYLFKKFLTVDVCLNSAFILTHLYRFYNLEE